MKIMSLNGWGGKRHADLLAFLRSDPPDVLCLQEVVHSPATTRDWLTYRDGDHVLDQRANFFRDVCHALPDHWAAFCPAAQGVLWDGDTAVRSFWGLATFVNNAFPVIGQVQGFVHKDYGPDGYGDHPRSRSAHGVRIYDSTRNRSVSITHMHGLRDLRGKMDTPQRQAQCQRLMALSDHVSEQADITIICGDFNVEADSQTLAILKAAGMVELVTKRGFQGTRTSLYPKPGKFADYLLIDDESAVQSFDVVRMPEVSDHCPLVLTL